MTNVTLPGTDELMRHRLTSLILSTGGPSIVKAAYSSGKPALGVGPGNAPAWIDSSADLEQAVDEILRSQGFDWGMICASEQSVVLDAPVADQALKIFKSKGAVVLREDRIRRLREIAIKKKAMNPKVVGQSPAKIARMAGFTVPETTTCLLVPLTEIGPGEPLSREVLAPILSVYRADGWRAGSQLMERILALGGAGHTLAIHARDEAAIFGIAEQNTAFRIVVNTSSSHGAVGASTHLFPSMTLGCGGPGNNASSENISPLHLLDYKQIAWPKDKRVDWPARRNVAGKKYFVGPHNNPLI